MRENQSGILVLSGFVAVFVLLILVLGGKGDNRIDASAIGTDGLEIWLNHNDIPAARSHRRTTLTEQEVALRILPIYDVDPRFTAEPASNRASRRNQSSQRDIDADTLLEKISFVPSLVMLPKWRAGVIELDFLDAQLLVGLLQFEPLLTVLNVPSLDLQRPDVKFLQSSRGITFYRPQLFTRASVQGSCQAHVTLPEGVLIARCEQDSGVPLFVLSDPDFINNHGLSLGQNAHAALDIIADLAGTNQGTVYVDTSTEIQLAPAPYIQREVRPRTVEEVSRFLTYPFSLIWTSGAISFLILLWRGLIRFGPPRRTDAGTITASKTASIAANGYLMRLAGDDRSLLQAFVADKMQALARDAMGKQVQISTPNLIARLLAIAPDNAPKLKSVLAELDQLPTDIPSADLVRLADRFEQNYRSIRDELGHVSRGR